MKTLLISASIAFFATTSFVMAEGVTANPLRSAKVTPKEQTNVAAPHGSTMKETVKDASPAAEKPKRERSAKQKQGDEDMRSCGTSWRAEKDSLKAKGETWRTYLKTCRAQLKSSRKA